MKSKTAFKRICMGFLLCSLTVSVCWLFCLRHGMFGSKVDWISQHSVLPDYFRRQFYATGDLFPEFAANIGGGQNIYYFSYYGLYSPVVLLSYLFPFIKMADYLMAAQAVGLMVSVLLLYRWLLGRGFQRKTSFFTAVLFLLSGPMVFQSYNQVMFVSYMPFLCMGFLGADRYFEKKKSGLLTISIFLMIMTSFYFSIGGMLVLCLYGLYRYTGERRRWQEGVLFLVPFIIAVLMSGVLLIPTAAALTGRKGGDGGIEVLSLLVPEFSPGRFFYLPYGIGLTTLSVTALISMMFFQKGKERVLAWGCALILTVPAFACALNGGLYIRDKVMIPFLPLLCYVTACYVDDLDRGRERQEGRRRLLSGGLPYVVTLCVLCVHFIRNGLGRNGKFLLADAALMLLCYGVFCVRKQGVILLALPILLLLLFGNAYHSQKNQYVSREFYESVTDEETAKEIRKAIEEEKGFYRAEQLGTDEENAANLNRIWDMGQYVSSIYASLYNDDYQQFRRNFGVEQPYRNFLMQPAVHHPVYQRFMGVKYVAEDGKVSENLLASPAAYATDKVMGETEYQTLPYPENQLALLTYAVAEKDGAEEQDLDEEIKRQKALPVKIFLPEEIHSEEAEKISVDFPEGSASEDEENGGAQRVLFLRFRIENLRPSRDVAVWAEGQRNKLTCEKHFYYNENTVFSYAIPVKEDQGQAELTFGAGHYRILDAECFLGRLPSKKDAEGLYQSELMLDKEKMKGNVIAGSIDVKSEGYFITSIPYDRNFEILLDGKSTGTEKVNTAFLGCRIEKGRHEVEIIYHAPGAAAGKAVSTAGVLLFLGWRVWEKRRKSRYRS